MRFAPCLALLLALLLVSACGGGGGGGAAAVIPATLDARIYESLSGTVHNDNPGGSIVRHDIWCAGDLSNNTTRRAFYSFIVGDLPPGAQVQSAVLSAKQYLVVGTPFATLGDVIVDHVDLGPTLNAPDYSHVQWSLDIGTFSSSPDIGRRALDVTAAVRADVAAGRGVSSFRLRHRLQTDIDGQRDYTAFSSVDWLEAHRRVSLVITYTAP
ncbi:MAG: hypothetical protein QNJ98_18725 [Planctomycetota bacterium]|nr:hypothetical protein [Planctomycetota bacterium]